MGNGEMGNGEVGRHPTEHGGAMLPSGSLLGYSRLLRPTTLLPLVLTTIDR